MTTTLTVLDVKKSLSAVWAKESDRNETYEFELDGDTAWGCTRRNGGGASRFKLSYYPKDERLWWGQSYFLDPADLKKKPDKVVWFRASDPSKRKGAFTWVKVREVHLVVSRKAQPKQFDKTSPGKAASHGKGSSSSSAATGLKTKEADPSVRASSTVRVAATTPTKAVGDAGIASGSSEAAVTRFRAGRPSPEVVLDLEQYIVIYKPPFWKCELPEKLSDAPKHKNDLILLRWIKEKLTDIDEPLFREDFNPALSGTGFGPLAHRIDGETSGLLLVCKTAAAQRHIKDQFHKTQVSKRYVCLVHGLVKAREGVIDASIRTVRTDQTTRSEVSSSGEWAETKYQVIATYSNAHRNRECASVPPGYTLVACDITSGRTHQIRIHMLHLGHPLVSDPKYLAKEGLAEDRSWCQRLFLHSYRMCFKDLNKQDVPLTCPLPDDLRSAVMSLGAADAEQEDELFEETLWQTDLLRPSRLKWRPGIGLQRKVAEILRKEAELMPLNVLNGMPEVRALMNDEGINGISKPWLLKHWEMFEIVPDPSTSDVCVRLRTQDGDDDVPGVDLDRQIESLQSEVQALVHQKQRAIAEEEYTQAAELKKRYESVNQQLQSLVDLRLQYSLADDLADGGLEAADVLAQAKAEAAILKKRNKIQVFAQDVKDESLFPSLGGGSVAKTMPTFKPKGVKESKHAGAASRETSTDSRVAASEASVDEAVPQVDLKDALMEFLSAREHFVAHINEINNDKYLRQVMRAQQPKPLTAVTKGWLGFHEDVFVVLRHADGDMYVAVEKNARPKGAAKGEAKPREAKNEKKEPAYHQVVQRMPGDAAPTLVYDYSAVAQKENKASGSSTDGTLDWTNMFLEALKNKPQKFCSIDELLAAVPQFAKGMGVRKINEQRALLLIFLKSCSDTFQVKSEGFGPDRKNNVYAIAKGLRSSV